MKCEMKYSFMTQGLYTTDLICDELKIGDFFFVWEAKQELGYLIMNALCCRRLFVRFR